MADHGIIPHGDQKEDESSDSTPALNIIPADEDQKNVEPAPDRTLTLAIRSVNPTQASPVPSVPTTTKAVSPAAHLEQARAKASPIIALAKSISKGVAENPMKKSVAKKGAVEKVEMLRRMTQRNLVKLAWEKRERSLGEVDSEKIESEKTELEAAKAESPESEEEAMDDIWYRASIQQELDKKLKREIAGKIHSKVQERLENSSKKRKLDVQDELLELQTGQESTLNPPKLSPKLTMTPTPETPWIDTVPLLGELNEHLVECRMNLKAAEIMDMRSWIDKGFDAGIRILLQKRPIDDVEDFWENKYGEGGLNDTLKSIVKEYDSVEDLHTLRVHFDRILGEEVVFVYQCDEFSPKEE